MLYLRHKLSGLITTYFFLDGVITGLRAESAPGRGHSKVRSIEKSILFNYNITAVKN